jgi:uncharacterized protein
MEPFLIPALLFLVAALYSSVGHGGASGYLAVLAVMNIPPYQMRPSALLLNLCVSAIAFQRFASKGHFRLRLFLPFAAGSIPCAFIGAGITVDPLLYERLLALCLLAAVGRMLLSGVKRDGTVRKANMAAAFLAGMVIGFLSGIIGIGGGILLSPLLLLLRWSTAHEAAAISALFILVNSAAGLLGLKDLSPLGEPQLIGWLIAAVTGGLVGAWLGAARSSDLRLRQVLAVVLLFASFKLWTA